MPFAKRFVTISVATAIFFPYFSSASGPPENMYLDMDLEQLLQIKVTTVSKKPQALKDSAAAVYVITQEDIRRSGVQTIPEALAMAPGLQVARISSSKWSISSRGFPGYSSNKLLILIDGRTVYSPTFSGTYWDQQNTLLEDIDRIEVIRGPGGTLWGANAVNGVINIITKHTGDTLGGIARVSVGDQNQVTAAGRYGVELNSSTNARAYITTGQYDNNKLNILNGYDGADANDGWKNLQGGFRVDGNGSAGTDWTISGDIYKNNEDQVIFPYWTQQPPYVSMAPDEIDAEGSNVIGRMKKELGNDSTFSVQAYYDYSTRDELLVKQQFHTFDAEVQYETKLGQMQDLTLGAGYRKIDSDFDSTYQMIIEGRNDNLYSAFIQDEISLVEDHLLLTLGVKYEHNDYTGSEWQPSARMLWKPDTSNAIWASAARAVRTPSIAETNGRVLVGVYPSPMGAMTASLVGNDNFGSEELYAYELGYRWQSNAYCSVDLAFFYYDYDDLYTLVPMLTASGVDLLFTNGTGGNSYGFEAAVNWKPARELDVIFTYSYLNIDLDGSLTDEFINSSLFFNNASPKHQFAIRSSYQLSDQWQFNFWLRYVEPIQTLSAFNKYNLELEVENYYLLDINVIWTPIENLEIMLAGQNLIDDKRLQYISEIITPATDIERGFYAKLTWRF